MHLTNCFDCVEFYLGYYTFILCILQLNNFVEIFMDFMLYLFFLLVHYHLS